MRVNVLAGRKGGVGKTTLCRHLAVEAERQGQGPVALIDCDPQGGLARWWNRRTAETPAYIETTLDQLPDTLERLQAAGYGQVFVDTPPAIGETIRAVVGFADLVIIPSRPSPDDLDAIGATVDLVEDAGKPLVFVVNGATKRARLTGQAAIVLSQHGTVAPSVIHHSVAFPSSSIDGRVVGELEPSGIPAKEIAELWAYIAGRQSKRPGVVAGIDDGKQASRKAAKEASS